MTGQFLQGLASCVDKIKIVDTQTDLPTPAGPRGAFAPKNKGRGVFLKKSVRN